jgi:solute:Na+ symporter, SSS family
MISLSATDWLICLGYLAAVGGVGLWCARSSSTSEDYFVGGRRMSWWLIGVSLFATAFSSLSFVGLPREAAYADYHLFLSILLIPLWVAPVVGRVFLPVYHRLRLTSAYEYLDRRFSRRVRLAGSSLYTIYCLGWLGSMLYAVGLVVVVALDIANDRLVWVVIVIGLFTTLYTVAGGIKGVIWNDLLQAVTLAAGIAIVLATAVGRIDRGWTGVWELALRYDKLQMLDLHLDRLTGGTFFSAAALGLFSFLSVFAVEQVMVQQYVSMPDVATARKALRLTAMIVVGADLMFFVVGTVAFAYYHQSLPPDAPAGSGFPPLARQDQLLPRFIKTEIMFPGLMGAFLAGLFAAAMSSLAGGLNCLTALLVCDWLPGRKLRTGATRLIVASFGLAVTGSALLAPRIGQNVYEIIIRIMGTLSGPLLGVFLLGMLLPRTNAAGALAGLAGGLVASVWLVFWPPVSYWWFSAITTLATITIGLVTSLFFPPQAARELEGLTVWTSAERSGDDAIKPGRSASATRHHRQGHV